MKVIAQLKHWVFRKFAIPLLALSALMTGAYAHAKANTYGYFYLTAGQSLPAGDGLVTLQSDGNVVIYKNGQALWSTNTWGHDECSVGWCSTVMQGDGNFVVYSGTTALFNTSTNYGSGNIVVVADTAPFFQIQTPGGSVVYSSPAAPLPNPISYGNGTADFGAFDIRVGQALTVGSTSLILQTDGNLVIYSNGVWAWQSSLGHNCSPSNCHLSFQGDGNLVAYDDSAGAFWQSSTIIAGIDRIQLDQNFPYFRMHSSVTNSWAVVPQGILKAPDGSVMSHVVSFR